MPGYFFLWVDGYFILLCGSGFFCGWCRCFCFFVFFCSVLLCLSSRICNFILTRVICLDSNCSCCPTGDFTCCSRYDISIYCRVVSRFVLFYVYSRSLVFFWGFFVFLVCLVFCGFGVFTLSLWGVFGWRFVVFFSRFCLLFFHFCSCFLMLCFGLALRAAPRGFSVRGVRTGFYERFPGKKKWLKRSWRFMHVTRLTGKQIGAGRLLCGFCPDVQGCDANIEL